MALRGALHAALPVCSPLPSLAKHTMLYCVGVILLLSTPKSFAQSGCGLLLLPLLLDAASPAGSRSAAGPDVRAADEMGHCVRDEVERISGDRRG